MAELSLGTVMARLKVVDGALELTVTGAEIQVEISLGGLAVLVFAAVLHFAAPYARRNR